MIFRHARDDDAAALAHLDLGTVHTEWLAEVAEIVGGLIAWRNDARHGHEDRTVIVVEDDGEIVAVSAHHLLTHEEDDSAAMEGHRYLMVTAVRADRQRDGIARHLVESVLTEMQRNGDTYVEWLVHPHNRASIKFTHDMFPTADETYPPKHKPLVQFTLIL